MWQYWHCSSSLMILTPVPEREGGRRGGGGGGGREGGMDGGRERERKRGGKGEREGSCVCERVHEVCVRECGVCIV